MNFVVVNIIAIHHIENPRENVSIMWDKGLKIYATRDIILIAAIIINSTTKMCFNPIEDKRPGVNALCTPLVVVKEKRALFSLVV